MKWSVELTSRFREINYKIISGTDAIKSNLPGDMIGVMVETDESGYETHNRMLLYHGSMVSLSERSHWEKDLCMSRIAELFISWNPSGQDSQVMRASKSAGRHP